jgi:SAM-dependent methyltransferase
MRTAQIDTATLERRLAEYPRWHYQFEFDNGITTPIYHKKFVNRHVQRRKYFFDALLTVTGGSLRGHRVLDLGCNAGYWSLAAAEADADFVLGIDGRQIYIDQANLVFEGKDVDPDRYRFELGDIFRHEIDDGFDIVLCLGLMYHISKPVELFELVRSVGAEVVVIDTEVFPSPRSVFRVDRVVTANPMTAVDHNVAFVPSRQALIDLAKVFGYETVPLRPNMTDYEGMRHYKVRTRLAFICSKRLPLDRLTPETRHPVPPRSTKTAWRITQAVKARTPAGREAKHYRKTNRERRAGLERQTG